MSASVIESVTPYLVAAVVPAIFIGPWIVFRWRFYRALKRKMYDDSGRNRCRRIRTETGARTSLAEPLLSAPRQRNQGSLQAAKRAATMRRRVFVVAGVAAPPSYP